MWCNTQTQQWQLSTFQYQSIYRMPLFCSRLTAAYLLFQESWLKNTYPRHRESKRASQPQIGNPTRPTRNSGTPFGRTTFSQLSSFLEKCNEEKCVPLRGGPKFRRVLPKGGGDPSQGV